MAQFGALHLALADMDEVFQQQLKREILTRLHELIDGELEKLAESTSRRIFSNLRYFQKPQEFAAELHHIIDIRRRP